MAQRGAHMLLADRPGLLTQTSVNLANEGKPIAVAGEGGIGNEKKHSAVRNNDTVLHHQQLADARPLQVVLDVLGRKSKPTIILDQPNDLVEVHASFELAGMEPAQPPETG